MKIARLNSVPDQSSIWDGGTEPDWHKDLREVVAVDDDHDFVGTEDTDLTDTDANAITNWDKYGQQLIGTHNDLDDWKAFRDEIKAAIENIAGSDYSSYGTMTAAQKLIACTYVPTKIVNNLGLLTFVTDAGGAAEATALLDNYLELSSQSRMRRYEKKLVEYVFKRLGQPQGLDIEDKIREDNLQGKYRERGVIRKADDGVDGLEDYFKGQNGYAGTGVLDRLNDAQDTLELIDDGSGQTNAEFCDACIEIVEKGKKH